MTKREIIIASLVAFFFVFMLGAVWFCGRMINYWGLDSIMGITWLMIGIICTAFSAFGMIWVLDTSLSND